MSELVELKQILTKLEALEIKSAQAQTAKAEGGIWGWVVALVVGAVVAVGAGLLIWQLNKKNEELAQLRTKIELDQIKAEQLEISASTTKHQDVVDRLEGTAAEIRARVAAREIILAESEAAVAEARARVVAAQNWDQLDSLNGEKR